MVPTVGKANPVTRRTTIGDAGPARSDGKHGFGPPTLGRLIGGNQTDSQTGSKAEPVPALCPYLEVRGSAEILSWDRRT